MPVMAAKTLRRTIGGVFLVGVMMVAWFALQLFPLGGLGKQVIVVVKPGDSLSTIAGRLHTSGVLSSPFAFRLDTLLLGSLVVQPGAYEIPQNDSFSGIRALLSGGPNAVVVSVTPGVALWEINQLLVQDKGSAYASGFMRAAQSRAATSSYGALSSFEGLIGPDDYVIAPGESPAALLAAMHASFTSMAQRVGFSPSSSIQGLSAYQMLIGASVVQKEGYYHVNMPKVARVILNRLATHGSLQMDSTVLYALHRDGGKVTSAMLQTVTPYNTYLNAGLPPTPICVVSPEALSAMLHPPVGSWRYFVLVKNDGTMAFSTTFAEQLANERLAQSRGLL